MLKGHVFKQQIFGNQIFALFINTFLNGRNGISNNYKNDMAITYNGSTLTVDSGAVCIQGRFLEEDTSTQIVAGTDTSYCKLVIEIDLSKQNTESELNQASYKIVKGTGSYPNLTQSDIVKNNEGIYQYELARFRTNTGGITDFQDMRTFLDFDSIYDAIQKEYREILEQLQEELVSVENGSAYVLNSNFAVIEGSFNSQARTSEDNIFNSFDLDFPDGFNKDNCVCIAIGININTNYSGYAYDIVNPSDIRSWNRSSVYRNVVLGKPNNTEKILLTVETPFTDSRLIKFKIILMKITGKEENYKLGDVNGDGTIDKNDLQMIQDYIRGDIALTTTQFKAADMNKDGLVNSADPLIWSNTFK